MNPVHTVLLVSCLLQLISHHGTVLQNLKLFSFTGDD